MTLNRSFFILLLIPVFSFVLSSCAKKDEPEALKADSTATPNAMMAMTPNDGLTPEERHFVATVLIGSKSMRGNAELAAQRTGAIKTLGSSLVEDHTKAFDELSQIARSKGLPIDTLPSAMQAGTKIHLAQLAGKEFDKEFLSITVGDLQKAQDDFKLIATSGNDSSLKAYAQKYLEITSKHLKHAQSISK